MWATSRAKWCSMFGAAKSPCDCTTWTHSHLPDGHLILALTAAITLVFWAWDIFEFLFIRAIIIIRPCPALHPPLPCPLSPSACLPAPAPPRCVEHSIDIGKRLQSSAFLSVRVPGAGCWAVHYYCEFGLAGVDNMVPDHMSEFRISKQDATRTPPCDHAPGLAPSVRGTRNCTLRLILVTRFRVRVRVTKSIGNDKF